MSWVATTSVHALPSARRRMAFLCPSWQRPASSTIASLTARSLFLLQNRALKFDWSDVGGEAINQIRGILSPPVWAKEKSHIVFWELQNVAFSIWLYTAGYTEHFTLYTAGYTAHFTYVQQAIQHIVYSRLHSTFHIIYSRLHSTFHIIYSRLHSTFHIVYSRLHSTFHIVYSRLHSSFHIVLQQATQHISHCIQQATQHISHCITAGYTAHFTLYTAGYTAYFTQLNKFSENNVFGSKTVFDTADSPTCYTFIQFRDGAVWFAVSLLQL